jgi:maltose-binding protein MalE
MNDEAPDHDEDALIQEARVWQGNGWTARVIKNEDDEGWAVAMFKDGEAEAALVGPWTMGRDKKNPKPLDINAFHTLVKTASEVIRRHEQALHARLHKSTVVSTAEGELKVTLDIVPDEDNPYAMLAAIDEMGEQVAQVRVDPGFKLSPASALAWIENDFRAPR